MSRSIRRASLDDVWSLAPVLRQRDVEEIYAAAGLTARDGLLRSFSDSTLAWTAEDDRGPFAIFGVTEVAPQVGCPWLLGADRLTTEHCRYFLRSSAEYIAQMLDQFPMLVNYVDARHADSLAYLRHVGFTISKLVPAWGFERRPFYRFTKVS